MKFHVLIYVEQNVKLATWRPKYFIKQYLFKVIFGGGVLQK